MLGLLKSNVFVSRKYEFLLGNREKEMLFMYQRHWKFLLIISLQSEIMLENDEFLLNSYERFVDKEVSNLWKGLEIIRIYDRGLGSSYCENLLRSWKSSEKQIKRKQ